MRVNNSIASTKVGRTYDIVLLGQLRVVEELLIGCIW